MDYGSSRRLPEFAMRLRYVSASEQPATAGSSSNSLPVPTITTSPSTTTQPMSASASPLLRIRFDDDDRHVLAIVQIPERVEYLLGAGRIEAQRRPVDEQEPRPHHERARDFQQAAFAMRKRSRGIVAAGGEARISGEDLFRGVPRVGVLARQVPAEPEVALDRHVEKERAVPQYVGDARIAQLRVRTEAGHVAPSDFDAPAANFGEAEDRMQDRGLAGAFGTDEAQRLSGSQSQVDAVQNLRRAVAGHEIVHAQQRMIARQRVEAVPHFGAVSPPVGRTIVAYRESRTSRRLRTNRSSVRDASVRIMQIHRVAPRRT